MLRKSPVFAVVAGLVISLGTGAVMKSTLTGVAMQALMVVIGKYVPAIGTIPNFYAICGTVLAAITGALMARGSAGATGLADLPDWLLDIDILIGEPAAIGHGVGPRSLGLVLDRFRADPFVAFAGLGTSVSNQRAIRRSRRPASACFANFMIRSLACAGT